MNKDFLKLGIIGNPLAHSISPSIQMTALHSVGLDGFYEKFETSANELPNIIEMFKREKFLGFNITIPHKTEIIKYLDEIDETAQKIGAVNTVKIIENQKLIGYNTDIYGFYNSLNGKSIKNAVIIGCGGAALAVVFGLEMLGCKNLIIYARNLPKANDFIENLQPKTKINLFAKPLTDLNNIEDTDILINATPLGTKGSAENQTAIAEDIFKETQNKIIVYDLVYNPAETLFLKAAKKHGHTAINGLNMLILQGAKAFEIWTGQTPDTEQMIQAAKKALKM